ncbi:MAG: MBL fold metallo-hydrolase [Nitrolancea sp.]
MVELTFLGTGTSNGIPMIGCTCPVCTSEDPRDRRGRTSAVIGFNGKSILIDTSPELRIQAVSAGIRDIDAVLFTHAHADHVAGIDDLRRFNELNQAHLPIFASEHTAELLRDRYGYAFQDMFPFYGGKPDLLLNVFDGPFELFGREVQPIKVTHGRWIVHGFRFGSLVYVTDAKGISDESIDLMRDADVLVINALRERPHPTHLSLGEALDVIAEVKPRQSYIVHVSHEVSHAAVSRALPPNVELAYDGLTVRTERDW